MPVGLNPKYEKSTTREKLTHGPAVFNNSGKIILESNNLGNLFRNYKHKNTTQIKQILNTINVRYLKNVQNMARQVKKAREYRLSNGNIKHKYMHDYWKWLTQVIPVLTTGQAPSIYKSPSPARTPLKEIQKKSPKKAGKMSHKERNIFKKLKAKKKLNNWSSMKTNIIMNTVPFEMMF